MRDDTNERARNLLETAGYSCREEPAWLKVHGGQVPDFHCTGPLEFWVEVKSIGATDAQKALFRQKAMLDARVQKVRANGKARGWVAAEADERAMKLVLNLAERILNASAAADRRRIAIVPRDALPNSYVRIEVSSEQGDLEVHAIEAASGSYGLIIAEEFITDATATVIHSNGSHQLCPAYQIFDIHNAVIALEIVPDPDPFRVVGLIGDVWKSSFVERVRSCATAANRQFKAACQVRPAPTLLMVFNDELGTGDERLFSSAFYGDLTITWQQGIDGVETFHGGNRLWQAARNTTTSAVSIGTEN